MKCVNFQLSRTIRVLPQHVGRFQMQNCTEMMVQETAFLMVLKQTVNGVFVSWNSCWRTWLRVHKPTWEVQGRVKMNILLITSISDVLEGM